MHFSHSHFIIRNTFTKFVHSHSGIYNAHTVCALLIHVLESTIYNILMHFCSPKIWNAQHLNCNLFIHLQEDATFLCMLLIEILGIATLLLFSLPYSEIDSIQKKAYALYA